MSDILVHKADQIATLTINRPEKRNAMTLAMWQALPDLMADVEDDPAIKVLLVTGGAHFSAGADISEFRTVRKGATGGRTYNAAVEAGETALAELTKPSIAVVHGFCIGGGCELALACDVRLAGDGARFAITPARIGLVYSMSGTRRLVDTVGPAWAKQILFTGDQMSAEQALRIGLVNEVHPSEELDGRARELASSIATRAQTSVLSSKAIVGRILRGQQTEDAGVEAMYEHGYTSRDYAEGVAAFVEKRTAVFD